MISAGYQSSAKQDILEFRAVILAMQLENVAKRYRDKECDAPAAAKLEALAYSLRQPDSLTADSVRAIRCKAEAIFSLHNR